MKPDFFPRETTRKTLFVKGEDCAGGNQKLKDRITVSLFLFSFFCDEKIKPLLISDVLSATLNDIRSICTNGFSALDTEAQIEITQFILQ